MKIAPHGGQQLDLTVFACGPTVTAALTQCGTKCCELSPDKGDANGACVLSLYGPPIWTPVGVQLVATDNPFTVKVAEGSGFLSAKPSVPRAALVDGAIVTVRAFAGVPACPVGPDNACQ